MKDLDIIKKSFANELARVKKSLQDFLTIDSDYRENDSLNLKEKNLLFHGKLVNFLSSIR